MDVSVSKLSVFFEDPFWIGLYERESKDGYQVCRIVFGAEPRDYEVYAYILKNWRNLRFSASIEARREPCHRVSPKRMQREIAHQVQHVGTGTRARQALQMQCEAGKQARAVRSREQRDAEAAHRFEQRREKRREKHRGH